MFHKKKYKNKKSTKNLHGVFKLANIKNCIIAFSFNQISDDKQDVLECFPLMKITSEASSSEES